MCLKITIQSSYKKTLEIFCKYLEQTIKNNKIQYSIIGLPKKVKKINLLRSPHVHKKAWDQYEIRTYKKLILLKNKTLPKKSLVLITNKPAILKVKINQEL